MTKPKLLAERRFPVRIDEVGRHIEDNPNGTLVEFSWRYGPQQNDSYPDFLSRDITIAVYSHGQVVRKYATVSWRTDRGGGYESMLPLFNDKERTIDLSISRVVYRVAFLGKWKFKRFGKQKAAYPGAVAIQKLEVV